MADFPVWVIFKGLICVLKRTTVRGEKVDGVLIWRITFLSRLELGYGVEFDVFGYLINQGIKCRKVLLGIIFGFTVK